METDGLETLQQHVPAFLCTSPHLYPDLSFGSDIEEITRKTGNFKKFVTFLKMLKSSLNQDSDSVFIDLLTYSDLEMLKNRKSRNPGTQNPGKANNKRYLILTYAVEFDRCDIIVAQFRMV